MHRKSAKSQNQPRKRFRARSDLVIMISSTLDGINTKMFQRGLVCCWYRCCFLFQKNVHRKNQSSAKSQSLKNQPWKRFRARSHLMIFMINSTLVDVNTEMFQRGLVYRYKRWKINGHRKSAKFSAHSDLLPVHSLVSIRKCFSVVWCSDMNAVFYSKHRKNCQCCPGHYLSTSVY